MSIYQARPFQSRNADDFDLWEVLDLFVDPVPNLADPFGYENSIVKGRMGSGKTMFLRANLAYHLFGIVPCLLEGTSPVIPVSVKLNDFQHLDQPGDIYKGIIVKVIEGLIKAYKDVQSCTHMARIHQGIQALPTGYVESPKLPSMFAKLVRLTSSEYTETIATHLSGEAGLQTTFFDASAKYEREHVAEIKAKPNPGISDVHHAYEHLLADRNGKILLLIDEAGSLGKAFFTNSGNGASLFEVIMNQLRTTSFIRTKIAIYPNTPADVLFETRYGDLVELSDTVLDPLGYQQFRAKAMALIERYVSKAVRRWTRAQEVFDLDSPQAPKEDALEQALYASGGNMRRLVQTLDQSMVVAFSDHAGGGAVSARHVFEALRRQSLGAENVYSESDREFLSAIANACRSRGTFKFQFPYKAPVLQKYASKSDEYNLLNVAEAGTGRKKTTYAFDYAYCVHHEIPTHYLKDTERIDKTRSRATGQWITRTAQMSEELLLHAKVLRKLNGQIGLLARNSGYLTDDSGREYWFLFSDVMDGGPDQVVVSGKKVLFYPSEFNGAPMAVAIEIL